VAATEPVLSKSTASMLESTEVSAVKVFSINIE
jgi:hypothetical protein